MACKKDMDRFTAELDRVRGSFGQFMKKHWRHSSVLDQSVFLQDWCLLSRSSETCTQELSSQ